MEIWISTNLIVLENFHFSVNQQKLFAFVFTIGFGIKVPIFPFHGWLPDVHSEGSTYGSILLAGILLKLGIYGLLRFGSTILPYGILYLSPLIFLWTLVGCFTCSYNCLRQYDLKKIIAYSSVTHINFAIASYHVLNGEMTFIKLKKLFENNSYLVETLYPENPITFANRDVFTNGEADKP